MNYLLPDVPASVGADADAVLSIDHSPVQTATSRAGVAAFAENHASRVAAGLGVPVESLGIKTAGSEAGQDAGQAFYEIYMEGVRLAVRADAMSAYIVETDPDTYNSEGLADRLGLADADAHSFPPTVASGSEKWWPVSRGRPSEPSTCLRFSFGEAQKSDTAQRNLTFETLALESVSLRRLFQADRYNPGSLDVIRATAAMPGSVIATASHVQQGRVGSDVFGRTVPPTLEGPHFSLKAGANVRMTEGGVFIAQRYGYVCLDDDRLIVLPPVWISPEEMIAYWLNIESHPVPVTMEAVEQMLADLGIHHGVRTDELKRGVHHVNRGDDDHRAFIVAEGTQSTPTGIPDLLVDLERRAGRVRKDGSIDFLGVSVAPTVTAGQCLARCEAPDSGLGAITVKGVETFVPEPSSGGSLRAGDNVEIKIPNSDVVEWTASADGVPHCDKDVLSVVPLLKLDGDVSFNTGNLNFEGEVFINGSILKGFSVKADRDITVAGKVESGATVWSGGDITISGEVIGRRTKVVARGNIRAQAVQDARVVAGSDIKLANYARNSYLRAGNSLTIQQAEGARNGMVGGQAWVRRCIDLHTAGLRTTLVAGLEPDQAGQLDRLNQKIGTLHEHTLRILKKFTLARFDLEQIRNMIAAARGPRQRLLVQYAKQLGQLSMLYKKLVMERKELEQRIGTAVDGTEILVRDYAYPGVLIRIGEHQHVLSEGSKGRKFRILDGKLVT